MQLDPGETIVAAVNRRDVVLIFTNYGRVFELGPSPNNMDYVIRLVIDR